MNPITIRHNGQIYVLFICGHPPVKDAQFFTKPDDEFQVGIFERKKGYEVKAHQHQERNDTIHHTSEFLYVEEGSAKVTVFDEEWKELHSQVVKAGDFLVFFRGGHHLMMLEKTRLIEVKQGPYKGDSSAKVFRS